MVLLSVFMYGRALDARKLALYWQKARRVGMLDQGIGIGGCWETWLLKGVELVLFWRATRSPCSALHCRPSSPPTCRSASCRQPAATGATGRSSLPSWLAASACCC